MSERSLLLNCLRLIAEALERIPRRFAAIEEPDDFVANSAGVDLMDSICMVLLATGEEIKRIDHQTNGEFLVRYPQVEWRGAVGLRDVLAHGYF